MNVNAGIQQKIGFSSGVFKKTTGVAMRYLIPYFS